MPTRVQAIVEMRNLIYPIGLLLGRTMTVVLTKRSRRRNQRLCRLESLTKKAVYKVWTRNRGILQRQCSQTDIGRLVCVLYGYLGMNRMIVRDDKILNQLPTCGYHSRMLRVPSGRDKTQTLVPHPRRVRRGVNLPHAKQGVADPGQRQFRLHKDGTRASTKRMDCAHTYILFGFAVASHACSSGEPFESSRTSEPRPPLKGARKTAAGLGEH